MYLIRPETLQEKRMQNFTFILVVLMLMLAAIYVLNIIFYRSLYLEVKDIFFSSGAVSDIMQSTEIAFNHVF